MDAMTKLDQQSLEECKGVSEDMGILHKWDNATLEEVVMAHCRGLQMVVKQYGPNDLTNRCVDAEDLLIKLMFNLIQLRRSGGDD